MLFTIITVFFLPLSFMSSFFALDIAEFARNRDGALGLGYVSEIMFPITVAVVAISLFFAFRLDLFLEFLAWSHRSLKRFPESLQKVLKPAWKIIKTFAFALLVTFALILTCCCYPCIRMSSRIYDRNRTERVEITEESYGRRRSRSPRTEEDLFGGGPRRLSARRRRSSASDSDEVIVIEEHSPPGRRRSRARGYRRGGPSRYYDSAPSRSIAARGSDSIFPFGAFLALFGLLLPRRRRRTETVEVVERYSGRRSHSPQTHTRWFGTRARQPTEVIIEERDSRRRISLTSPEGSWYMDDETRSAPKRKKWPPWAWFEKSQAPTGRSRSRDVRVTEEIPPAGLKGIYAWFIAWIITPLLVLFGISRWTERRHSRTSSFSYTSSSSSHTRASSPSSDRRSRRSRRIVVI